MDVRKARKAARVSQVELGQITGIARTRIIAAESGAVKLSDDEFRAIRRALATVVHQRVIALHDELVATA